MVVVSDNVAPEFVSGQPTSGTVPERASEHEIATFTGTDANHQTVTFAIESKMVKADEDAKADEIAHIEKVNSDASAILLSLDQIAFGTTGVLKTKKKDAKDAKQPDFNEAPVDDPDTTEDESDPKYPPVNEYVYVISLYDGTLESEDNIEFTLTVTDLDEARAGSRQRLNIDEDNDGGEEKPLEPAVSITGAGLYKIDQQIDNEGNIVGAEDDEEDILFDVTSEGGIYLREKGSIDFESGVVTYTLSVKRTTGDSKLIVVSVNDVDEAPKFSAADKRMQNADDPDGVKQVNEDGDVTAEDVQVINLYVLESAEIDDIVSIGQDAGGNPTPTRATFVATDEDDNADNPAWSVISYNLWHDADLTDDEDARDEEYSGTDAMVSVDSSGFHQGEQKAQH